MPRSGSALFSTLFFLSGLAGLLYEVCWTRLLRLPMGNTVYSLTVVLTAFMGGLALGSWLAGRWIDRHGNPLKVYALLEACIGASCLALPWIVRAEEPLFRWAYRHMADSFVAFHLLKFVACGAAILVPATLMGATLPVLCRHFITDVRRVGRSVGWFYAVNAFGAVAGSLLAGFVLIPKLGMQAAILVGVGTSLFVAAVAWVAQARRPAELPAAAETSSTPTSTTAFDTGALELLPPRLRRTVLLGYGLSGLAAMVFQIAWARVLALVLGSSVYAFALLVSAFILGLAVGASVASRFADRLRRPVIGFAVAELGIGFTALAMVPVFQRFPEWMLHIVPQVSQNFERFQLVQFALLFGALLLPTACMGACLPLVGRALLHGVSRAGETVGNAYAANAVGTIVGAFVGGFFMVPTFGIQASILIGSAVSLGVGVVLLLLCLRRPTRFLVGAAAAIAGGVALALVPAFDPVLLTSGTYLYAESLRDAVQPGADLKKILGEEYNILLHREGLSSTITVKENSAGVRSLAINGKVDASDYTDMATQLISGHLACLLHPEPRDVCIVGLATGVTLNSVAQHPTVRSIDCIEIDSEMVDAARLFDHVNGRILDDPRLRLVIQDGRNHLTLTEKSYDVILSEPSNPWVAGIASLYTREFLQACHDRLRPEGVMVLWMHVYGFDLHAIASMTRTFATVFPNATLWETYFLADYVLIGTKRALHVDYEKFVARLQQPAVSADLLRLNIVTPADLLVRHVADAQGVQRLAYGGDVYSDDRNQLEFDAPRLMYHQLDLQELGILQDLRRPGMPPWLQVPAGGFPAHDVAQIDSSQVAQRDFWNGMNAKVRGDSPQATQLFMAALDRHPRLANVADPLLETTRQVVDRALARGDTLEAEQLYARILAHRPGVPGFYNDFGVLLAQRGDLAAAEAAYRKALELRPGNVDVRANLALSMALQGRGKEAESELRLLLARRPAALRARLYLGTLLAQRGDFRSAELEYRMAVDTSPDRAETWFLLGEARRARSAWREAAEAYEAALDRQPGMPQARGHLAECYRALGQVEKARAVAQASPPTPQAP